MVKRDNDSLSELLAPCALRPHLNAENAGELFAARSRKSYEQALGIKPGAPSTEATTE